MLSKSFLYGFGSRNQDTTNFSHGRNQQQDNINFNNPHQNQSGINASSNHTNSYQQAPFQNGSLYNHNMSNPGYMDLNQHPQPVLLRDNSNLRPRGAKFKNFAGFSQIYADNLFEEFFRDD